MINLALPLAFGFVLVLFRTAGLFFAAPIFSNGVVPMRIRMAIAVVVATAVFCGAGMPQVEPPTSILRLAQAGIAETCIGLVAGLCARMVMDAAMAAGQVAGLSAGLGYASVIDPFNGVPSSVTGQLLSTLTLGCVVALNAHGEAIAWLCRSVVALPPNSSPDISRMLTTTLSTAAWTCAFSIRISFPFLAAGLMAHLAMGVLNRAVPSLNLSTIGFSVSLLAGGGAIYFVAPDAAQAVSQAVISIFARG